MPSKTDDFIKYDKFADKTADFYKKTLNSVSKMKVHFLLRSAFSSPLTMSAMSTQITRGFGPMSYAYNSTQQLPAE